MKRFTAPLLLAGLLLLVTPVLATAHCGACGKAEAAGKTECAKPCPAKSAADCKQDCAKPCCAKAKADCKKDCARHCCAKAKADCRQDCARHCCAKAKADCKQDCPQRCAVKAAASGCQKDCAKAPACDKSEKKRDTSRRGA